MLLTEKAFLSLERKLIRERNNSMAALRVELRTSGFLNVLRNQHFCEMLKTKISYEILSMNVTPYYS